MKNRIEVLEEVVGELTKRTYELEEENRTLNEKIQNKLYTNVISYNKYTDLLSANICICQKLKNLL